MVIKKINTISSRLWGNLMCLDSLNLKSMYFKVYGLNLTIEKVCGSNLIVEKVYGLNLVVEILLFLILLKIGTCNK
jgi:hypothetical protein